MTSSCEQRVHPITVIIDHADSTYKYRETTYDHSDNDEPYDDFEYICKGCRNGCCECIEDYKCNGVCYKCGGKSEYEYITEAYGIQPEYLEHEHEDLLCHCEDCSSNDGICSYDIMEYLRTLDIVCPDEGDEYLKYFK
jgi:hypothetical protein